MNIKYENVLNVTKAVWGDSRQSKLNNVKVNTLLDSLLVECNLIIRSITKDFVERDVVGVYNFLNPTDDKMYYNIEVTEPNNKRKSIVMAYDSVLNEVYITKVDESTVIVESQALVIVLKEKE